MIQGLIKIIFGFGAGCNAYGFWSTVGALAEIWSLAAVSRDRYNAVFYPFNDAKRMTRPQVCSFDTLCTANYLLFILAVCIDFSSFKIKLSSS